MNESEHMEFKRSWHEECLKTICGFSNAMGGSLLVGVNDGGEVVGADDYKTLQEDIPNKIKSAMGITVMVVLREQHGKHYLEIIIPAFQQAVSLRGRYYRRSGSTNQELSGSELAEFLLARFGRTWDNAVEKHFSLDDIDLGALERYKALAKDRLPFISHETNALVLLEKLNLSEGGYLKRAAVLLFGKDVQKHFTQAQVKIGRFTSAANLVWADTVTGNLFQQLEGVLDLLRAKYLKAQIYYEGIYRKEALELPLPALREALINALIHRSYMTTSAVQLRVNDECLRISNAGNLPDRLHVEDLKTEHLSIPRNPILADIFYKAGLIESWGRGTLQIVSLCRDHGLAEPVFENSDHAFTVSLYRPDLKTDLKTDLKADLKTIHVDELICQLIKANRHITLREVSMALGKSLTITKEHIRRLKEEARIRRVGPDKGGYWEVGD